MEILRWLNDSPVISDFVILEYKSFSTGFYIKIKAELKNKNELYIREYSDSKERNYSYHLQNPKGQLIVRWDNAPHYKNLFNAPHHKHIREKIEPSNEITLQDVLKFVEAMK